MTAPAERSAECLACMRHFDVAPTGGWCPRCSRWSLWAYVELDAFLERLRAQREPRRAA